MPYTLSHLSIPLMCKRYPNFDRLAAVIGSLVPDLGYLLGWSMSFTDQIHGWTGALIFGLPITLFLYFGALFFKIQIFSLTGFSLSNHLNALNPKKILAWILSATLGLWSHVFLDGFTHMNGWAHVSSYHLLQYLLSLIGIFILGIILYKRRAHRLVTGPMRTVIILASLTTCLLALPGGLSQNYEVFVVQLTTNWMRGVAAFSLIYCSFLKMRNC